MIHTYLPWNHPEEWLPRPWLRDANTELTYGKAAAWIDAVAAQLHSKEIGEGDVVAVMMSNRVEFPVVMMAAWRLGAVVTPVNPTLTTMEADYQIVDAAAKLVIHDNAPADLSAHMSLSLDDLAPPHSTPDPAMLPPIPSDLGDAVALLIYTSGSTGRPKGVMLTHDNLVSMADMLATHFHLTEVDHCLLVLPLFHVNAICVSFLASTYRGAQLTILRRFDAPSFMTAIREHGPTYFSAVPTLLARIIELPEEQTGRITSVRFVLCGAAPVSAELLDRVEKRLGITLVEGYGLTEGTCVSCCNPIDGIRRLGSVGPVLPGQEVRLVDESGKTVATGETGEVVVRGKNVMRGYLNRPGSTAETIVDGWLHTGDVGRFDEDGYLTLVDRIKDMIIRGGENLYPKEIENALYGHADVLEAAVVGRSDDVYGEVPVAFVVPYPGAEVSEETLRLHLESTLAKIKIPVQIHILANMPKNPVGKIDKPGLRTQLRM
ncbi:class I adenylate-forming enzyme family protein [Rhodococcus qingshengii]|uniref:class I adenylate-forming enzyme family protein n=1 Tax=Rhodococcus qingshengii TaxID=334542 RepID=UPI0002B7C48A|nr:AMP-binding protein [Rhodococcus qingshengii]EME16423.1 acyl-CoA synthetase [Rhodococcus qingshengii BKS 20-40]